MTEGMGMQEYIAKHGLTMTASPLKTRNDRLMGDLPFHWSCVITGRHGSMTVEFSMGKGHATEKSKRLHPLNPDFWPLRSKTPTLVDVLECLSLDASSVLNSPRFEDWCADYGYDTDSRKAEEIYRACQGQTGQLRQVVGGEALEELAFEVCS